LKAIPFISLLTLIFVALKLTGVFTASWWWVFSPLWITASAVVAIIVGVIIVILALELRDQFKKEGKL
jgi:uncharacterized membrane protein